MLLALPELGLADEDADADGLMEADTDADGLFDVDGLIEGDNELDGLRDADGLSDVDGLRDADGLTIVTANVNEPLLVNVWSVLPPDVVMVPPVAVAKLPVG